jgi:hypothetical protein
MALTKNGDISFIFMIFMGLILAIALINPIADQIFTNTNDASLVNGTYAMPLANVSIDLAGRNILSTPVVTNATSGVIIASGNYTIADGTGTDGLISVRITSTDAATTSGYAGTNVNISYSYQPDGSMPTSGSRSILNIVLIFGVLGVLMFSITQLYKQESFTKLIKGMR